MIHPQDIARQPPFVWLHTTIEAAVHSDGSLDREVAAAIFAEFQRRLDAWCETIALGLAEGIVEDLQGAEYRTVYEIIRTALGEVEAEAKRQLCRLVRPAE